MNVSIPHWFSHVPSLSSSDDEETMTCKLGQLIGELAEEEIVPKFH